MRHLTSPLVLLFAASLWLQASAQEIPSQEDRKAAQVVDDFYRMLNLDSLRTDSILYIESHIVPNGHTDTLTMRRWTATRHRQRVEFWYQGILQMCLFSDGRTYYESYREEEGWKSVNRSDYYDAVEIYDIHGPLYQWREHGEELTYEGTVLFEGNRVERIGSRSPLHYDRHYYFEQESKLMFLYTESDSIGGEPSPITTRNRVDWHAYHEYQPLGNILLPSVESYQHQGSITLIFNRASYVALDERIFTQRQMP